MTERRLRRDSEQKGKVYSICKYFRPEPSQSSDISMATAVTNREQDSTLGNIVATLVLLLISLFNLSSIFKDIEPELLQGEVNRIAESYLKYSSWYK